VITKTKPNKRFKSGQKTVGFVRAIANYFYPFIYGVMQKRELMFKATIKIYIYDGINLDESTSWVLAHRKIELPFTPYIGLNLQIHPTSYKIKDVTWLVDGSCFVCDLQELYTTLGLDDFTFDEYQSEYKKYGWSLIGPHPLEN
jgi:hypothetical protein